MKNLNIIVKKINQRQIFTAERPTQLGADALARYRFASRYCRGKRVLDIGTGMGFGAKYLAEKGASQVLGIDYSKETIKWASSHNKLKQVSFLQLDALDIASINKRFDCVVAFEIIEHLAVKDALDFVRSLCNVLKPGGTLLLSTPNGLKTQFVFGRPYNPYHVKEYTAVELTQLLKPCFTKIRVKGLDYRNRNYIHAQKQLKKIPFYKLIYLLGHFKIVREFVPLIPKRIRETITKENTLPMYKQSDFVLLKDFKRCSGLFIYAQKKKK